MSGGEEYRPQEALDRVHERQSVLFSDRSEEFFFFLKTQTNSVEMYLLRCTKLQKPFKTVTLLR